MLLAALALGAAVGLVLGGLGGGGSVLTVPALVFALGLTAQEATTASLVIVGTTAAVAAVGHARAGQVRWRRGLLLGAAGVPAALLGTAANRLVDEDVLLLAFAVLMLVAAAGMLADVARVRHAPSDAGKRATDRGLWLRVLGAGLLVGVLTGFFGVGGGFVIVPVLVVALDFPIAAAVGTSLVVIALNAGVSLGGAGGRQTSPGTWSCRSRRRRAGSFAGSGSPTGCRPDADPRLRRAARPGRRLRRGRRRRRGRLSPSQGWL